MPSIDELSRAGAIADADELALFSKANGSTRKVTAPQLAAYVQKAIEGEPDEAVYSVTTDGGGFAVTVLPTTPGGNVWAQIALSGPAPSGTIILPGADDRANGQEVLVTCTHDVQALSINAQDAALRGAPTLIATNGAFRLRYDSISNTWFRIEEAGVVGAAALTFTQAGADAVPRSLQEKERDVLSVRDFITGKVDGIISNQAAIVAAVTAAYVIDAILEWPAGTYVSTDTVPNLHKVRHVGAGVIKRGANLFYLEQRASGQNTLFCAPDGSGDGLSADQPVDLAAALVALKNYGPGLKGKWRLKLAAGLHPAPPEISGLTSTEYLTIEGNSASNNITWDTIIAGDSAGASLFIRGPIKVNLLNLDVSNVNAGSVASAISLDGGAMAWIRDCRARDARGNGINSNIGTRVLVDGCVVDNIQGTGVLIYNATGATGYNGRRTTIRNCKNAVTVQAGYGHIDNTDFSDCPSGILSISQSHTTNYGNTFTNVTVAAEDDAHSGINTKNCTYTNVTTKHRSAILDGDEFSPDGTVGSGFDRTFQYYRFLGTKGRFAMGYGDWEVPFVPFQYSNGTKAGFSLSSFGAATAVWETNGNTILGLAAPDANYTAWWFGDSTSPRRGEIRQSGGSIVLYFSTVGAFRFRSTDFAPLVDNTTSSGTASLRHSVVYAGTGTINTSDGRDKEDAGPIPDAVLDAWADVNFVQYRWRDAVAKKGEAARFHVGVIAQQIQAAFAARGLDAFDYGLLCFDEWGDEFEPVTDEKGKPTGETRLLVAAGNRFGIRADECLFLEAALMRRTTDRLAKILEGS